MHERHILSSDAFDRLLAVNQRLGKPVDLATLLNEIVDASLAILDAERGSVFLYDSTARELHTAVATGVAEIRVSINQGIVGDCVRRRTLINVQDCYADPRFNPEFDRRNGYRTRCLLTVPLIGYDDSLVGALQVLNKRDGVFSDADESAATALGALCAVAIQRVRMTDELVAKGRMEHELALARDIQMGALPETLPAVRGYDVAGWSRPADQTGGDSYDVVPLDDHRVLLFVADASGHGIASAVVVMQLRAMLRMSLRLEASLGAAIPQMNSQLLEDLRQGKYVTAFLGVLDNLANTIAYHALGQGPLLQFHAATGTCEYRAATTQPLGLLEDLVTGAPQMFRLDPGDIVALVTDGVIEYPDNTDEPFGASRLANVICDNHHEPMPVLINAIVHAVGVHACGVRQPDDMTLLIIRRLPD